MLALGSSLGTMAYSSVRSEQIPLKNKEIFRLTQGRCSSIMRLVLAEREARL